MILSFDDRLMLCWIYLYQQNEPLLCQMLQKEDFCKCQLPYIIWLCYTFFVEDATSNGIVGGDMGYRYIGSKARIADEIINYLGAPKEGDGYFVDAFSGTGIVASKAADMGWKVKINDMMHNAAIVSEARLLSSEDVSFYKLGGYKKALTILNESNKEGFFWREYSPASLQEIGIERKYFTEENAARIDGIIATVHQWKNTQVINKQEFSLLISTLIYAMNNVANIAGTYGCFLSKWQSNALDKIELKPLEIRKKKVVYSVSVSDVFSINSKKEDTVYLDPPYTKRQYASYYHILETAVIGDEPKVEGVAGLRPWKNKASIFCYKQKALKALVDLVISQKANRILVSYSNDGHIQLDQLVCELKKTGIVYVRDLGYIGRYRPNVIAGANKQEVKEYIIDYRH